MKTSFHFREIEEGGNQREKNDRDHHGTAAARAHHEGSSDAETTSEASAQSRTVTVEQFGNLTA